MLFYLFVKYKGELSPFLQGKIDFWYVVKCILLYEQRYGSTVLLKFDKLCFRTRKIRKTIRFNDCI